VTVAPETKVAIAEAIAPHKVSTSFICAVVADGRLAKKADFRLVFNVAVLSAIEN
jgi:hypothetical protein